MNPCDGKCYFWNLDLIEGIAISILAFESFDLDTIFCRAGLNGIDNRNHPSWGFCKCWLGNEAIEFVLSIDIEDEEPVGIKMSMGPAKNFGPLRKIEHMLNCIEGADYAASEYIPSSELEEESSM